MGALDKVLLYGQGLTVTVATIACIGSLLMAYTTGSWVWLLAFLVYLLSAIDNGLDLTGKKEYETPAGFMLNLIGESAMIFFASWLLWLHYTTGLFTSAFFPFCYGFIFALVLTILASVIDLGRAFHYWTSRRLVKRGLGEEEERFWRVV